MTLTCTICGFEIPDPPGRKYLVVFPLLWGGIRIEVGCDHHEVDPAGAIAVFSSAGCCNTWLDNVWHPHLAGCQHDDPREKPS